MAVFFGQTNVFARKPRQGGKVALDFGDRLPDGGNVKQGVVQRAVTCVSFESNMNVFLSYLGRGSLIVMC